jgi:hypothetical protein
MIVKATIKPNGEVLTEVIDRQQDLCSKVYQVTNALGRQLSDEDTGPECDTVREVTSE